MLKNQLLGASKMAQVAKVPVAKPDDLSLITGWDLHSGE